MFPESRLWLLCRKSVDWAPCGPMRSQKHRLLATSDTSRSTGCYALVVSAVLMPGFGGRIGGHIMPRVQLPAVTPKHKAWNKGQIIGQKRPLLPKQVWAIRARLELAGYLRDLALFNVAVDSKLRGCDLVTLAVPDLVKEDRVRERVSVIQSKTKKPVQFELTENTRDSVIAWARSPEMIGCRFMFPSRFHDRPHISTRQYGRLVRDWVTAIGLGVCVILCPGAFSYAMGKRSSNIMASWLLTRCHSRTDRFHSTEVALRAK
jgi:integrase